MVLGSWAAGLPPHLPLGNHGAGPQGTCLAYPLPHIGLHMCPGVSATIPSSEAGRTVQGSEQGLQGLKEQSAADDPETVGPGLGCASEPVHLCGGTVDPA